MTGLRSRQPMDCHRWMNTDEQVSVWDRELRVWRDMPLADAMKYPIVERSSPVEKGGLGFGTLCVHTALGIIGALAAIALGSILLKVIFRIWSGM